MHPPHRAGSHARIGALLPAIIARVLAWLDRAIGAAPRGPASRKVGDGVEVSVDEAVAILRFKAVSGAVEHSDFED
jgi:hypothetical protein